MRRSTPWSPTTPRPDWTSRSTRRACRGRWAHAADQAAYRILQEALTNAARHGSRQRPLELRFGDAAVELTRHQPRRPSAAAAGGGHGLIGMRERATLLGGSLDAERANGAFRVRARIPYGGHRG